MRFRVLGATEILASGDPAPLSSERQRRLLAALAMRSPDAVSVDRLIEAVWGDRRPGNAGNALRTVATRLRHSLDAVEPGIGERVVARRPGYLLDVPADWIDANHFAELASLGRRHLTEGDLEAARATLHEALDFWGGAPYDEFGGEPWVQAEVARLERLWVAAREADIEARLASGLHVDALADIQSLIADEPFSDGPRALMMRALFATGRQAEAVRVFQDYRALLAEELGLEPGPDLADLEQQVLANDPALLPESGRPLRGYRLHERLTTTERGEVFRATQPGLERDVAIEMVGEALADDAAFVRSFELEGRALARLGHANVVPVYDCWREPGGAYLVRGLLTGGSLADPDVRDHLGAEGLARVRDQVRSALDVAHHAGLVHGPIEPVDVQLDDYGTAYLANFHLGGGDATATDDDRSFDRLFDALVGPAIDTVTPAPTRLGNPYRGLAAFRESDVDVFFGRDRLVHETLDTLEHHGAAVVVGPSGSGKSSLVRAGVVPALTAGELEGSADWFVITMVPGASPFAELGAAVLRVAVHAPSGLIDQLRDPREPLTRTIQRVLPDPDTTTVLVIDQFEELFTLTAVEERGRFLEALSTALRDGGGSLKLVATLRADFYDQPLAHGAIAGLVKRTTVAVDALTGDESRAAIVEPARTVGVEVEPDLVGRLVADASGRPGTLPMLQFVLTRLFDARDDGVLALASYLAMGGLAGAVGARAEEIYDDLDPAQRELSRRLFGRLVAVDEVDDARRRVRTSEVRAAEDRPDDLDTVADRFVQARLLSTDRDPTTREPTLEVAHEALFREWPRLSAWIDDDRDGLRIHRHLTTTATAWQSRGEDEADLYRGSRLETALAWAPTHVRELNELESRFLDASSRRHDFEVEKTRRQTRRLRRSLGAVATVAAIAVVAGLLAVREQRQGDEVRREAEDSRDQLAAQEAATAATNRTLRLERLRDAAADEPDQELALLLALEVEAMAEQDDPVALDALAHALLKNPGRTLPAGWLGELSAIDALVIREPGALVIRSRDRPHLTERRIPVGDEPESIQYRPEVAPDGRRVAVGTADGIMIIDASTGAVGDPVPSPGMRARIPLVQWTSDSQLLANTDPVTIFAVDDLELDQTGELKLDELVPGPRTRPVPGTILVADPVRARLAIHASLGRVDVLDTSVPLEPEAVVATHVIDGAQVIVPAWTSEGDLLIASAFSQPPIPDNRFWVAPSTDPQTLQPVDADMRVGQINEVGDGTLFVGGFGNAALVDRDGALVAGPWPLDDDSSTAGFALELDDGRVIFQTTDASTLAPNGIVIRSRSEGDSIRSELSGLDVEPGMIVQYLPASGLATVASQPSATLFYHAIQVQQIWDVRGPVPVRLDHDPDQEFDRVRVSETDDGPVVIGLTDPDLPGNDALTCAHCASGGVVSIMDAFSGEPIGKVDVEPGFGVSGFYLSRDRQELTVFADSAESEKLLVFDVATNPRIGEVELPKALPTWVVRNEELGLGYAATAAGLTIYDLETREIVDQVAVDSAFDSRILPDDTGERVVIAGSESLLVAGLPYLTDPVVIANPEGLAGRLDRSGQVVIGWGSGSDDGVQLWHAATGRPLGPFLPGPVGDQHIGGAVAQVSDDGVLVWEIDPDSWDEKACKLVGRTLTRSEWRTYVSRTDPYDPVDCTRTS